MLPIISCALAGARSENLKKSEIFLATHGTVGCLARPAECCRRREGMHNNGSPGSWELARRRVT